jgi:hypothetical protein
MPQQQSYGESLAQSLKAQAEFLQGTGDFAETGSLESLLPLEESVRRKTAQTDTDVLRQTLLGTRQEATSGTYDDQGRLVIGYEGGKEATTVKPVIELKKLPLSQKQRDARQRGRGPNLGSIPGTIQVTVRDPNTNDLIGQGQVSGMTEDQIRKLPELTLSGRKVNLQGINVPSEESVPVYAKDPNGEIIVDKSKAGQTETIPATFTGDGMINLLGDSRNVQEFTTRQATQEDVDAGLASEVGETITVQTGDRKAGFASEEDGGQFLGLSALAEDIQRGNLSRQREADLADVERLSGRFQDVMEDFKPAATSGLDDARLLLEQQRENLTGLRKATQADVDEGLATEVGEMFQTGTGSGGPVRIPTSDTFGGSVTPATMTAAQLGVGPTLDADTSFDAAKVADPLRLQANTQFQGALATGTDNQNTLRSKLLGDAKTALDTGLTDREQAQIANAARARQTLMGRTFDQSGAIAEAEARVQEDNARRMQNRAFAQSVLGQEAGLQQGDITRGMAQESEQAGLNQRRDLAQSQLDQDALRTSMLTGVQQDLDQAKFDQQRDLAQAELTQQANAFGAQSAQQAALANQAQRQQANQFGVGATMDAERLNETLRQQGLSNYINAVGNLAQVEDQYTLDPFRALLGRGGGGSLQAGQSVFGQAGYGLNSGPQYLNPEAGLGFISQNAANQANMYAANVAADASRTGGIFGGLGALGGGLLSNPNLTFCWVAREVYGPMNPQWLMFREWMFAESPRWFFEIYAKYGERFASWISDKPRLKGIMRKWMDSKIGDK